ncbi:MAG: antibiotic biosynthesis monooxygenase [Verrucomicrobiales bacterium]|nr:antibiotic biosynthesis monooxygenase [Verrucomicrobiales bacterium]
MIIQDKTTLPEEHPGPVVLVNTFTAKPDQMPAFVAAQTAEYKRLLGRVEGWRGNRLHVSLDGCTAVNYAIFDSLQAYKDWRASALFMEHVAMIAPFVERSEPRIFRPLYDAGELSLPTHDTLSPQ